jgi:D-glycero-D-manno-heptose 1,7-bisphosphate phosphatase
MVMKQAVFFDRDGVLNRPIIRKKKPYAPRKLEDFLIYKDAKLSIKKLIKNNFLIFVITNQPDIGNGLMKREELEYMHQKLKTDIEIDKIYICEHSQKEKCECRKPSPFFLMQAKNEYNLDIQSCYFVGDRYSDMQASRSMKCKSIFIDRKYDETPSMDFVHKVNGIKEAVNYILRKDR